MTIVKSATKKSIILIPPHKKINRLSLNLASVSISRLLSQIKKKQTLATAKVRSKNKETFTVDGKGLANNIPLPTKPGFPRLDDFAVAATPL
jgi:hypothetical protein